MARFYTLLLTLCFILLTFSGVTRADIKTDIEQLQEQIEQIGESESPADKTRKQLLQKILTAKQSQVQLRTQIADLQTEIDNQPATIKALRTVLEHGLKPVTIKSPERLSDEELDQQLTSVNTRLLELERDMALQQQAQSQAEQRQQSIREQLTGLKLDLEVKEGGESTDFSELRQQLERASFTEGQLRVQAL